jgi:hypothetical protein
MKSTKSDPVTMRGAPGETPDITKLSPERQALKDAIDYIITTGVGGALEFIVPFVAAPTVQPPPQADPSNPDCLCTT